MLLGSITIDDQGEIDPSSSGAALVLYNLIKSIQPPGPDPESPPADWDQSAAAWRDTMKPYMVKLRRAWAREATAHASLVATRVLSTVTGTTTLTAAADMVLAGTRAAAFSVTLPSNAPVGATVDIVDQSGQGATYPITIAAPVGESIAGATPLNTAFGSRKAVKTAATAWRVFT